MIDLFQQFYKRFVTMVIFFVQINRSFCETYDGSNQGYASVPTDIPSGRTRIILDNNEISHIDDESFNETFTDFSTVQILYLEINTIENISERSFEGFQRLEIIYLYRNLLKHILIKEEDIPRLKSLYLFSNQLAQVPTFYGYFQLMGTLHLAGNFISYVYGEDFENITNIRYINLASNRLVIFEPRQELPNLSNLDLDNNELTMIPMLKGTYRSIRRIDLYNNKVTIESLLTLKKRINGSEQSLTELIFSGNEDIATNLPIVVNFLKPFPELRTLGIINSKTNRIFHLTNRLDTLYLSFNNISQITKDDFNVRNEYDVFKLYLDGNPIQSLPNLYEYLMDFNSNQTMIYLRYIRFRCDNLCWMTKRG